MAKKKTKIGVPEIIIAIILLAIAVVLIVWACGGFDKKDTKAPEKEVVSTETEKENQGGDVKPDSPSWHGNGVTEITPPPQPDPENGESTEPAPVMYSMLCYFGGKMDENSFEVTEIATNEETGEEVTLDIVEMRVGNESVRQDVDILEMGERINVIFTYNEDSQIVADRIMFLTFEED